VVGIDPLVPAVFLGRGSHLVLMQRKVQGMNRNREATLRLPRFLIKTKMGMGWGWRCRALWDSIIQVCGNANVRWTSCSRTTGECYSVWWNYRVACGKHRQLQKRPSKPCNITRGNYVVGTNQCGLCTVGCRRPSCYCTSYIRGINHYSCGSELLRISRTAGASRM